MASGRHAWRCDCALLAAIVIALFIYIQSDNSGNGSCPDMPLNEVRHGVSTYVDREFNRPEPTLIERTPYSRDFTQWNAPHRINGRRYIAEINCAQRVLDHVGAPSKHNRSTTRVARLGD